MKNPRRSLRRRGFGFGCFPLRRDDACYYQYDGTYHAKAGKGAGQRTSRGGSNHGGPESNENVNEKRSRSMPGRRGPRKSRAGSVACVNPTHPFVMPAVLRFLNTPSEMPLV